MVEAFVARQPILQADQALAGYELLFRRAASGPADVHDDDEATSQVILSAFTELGLERVVGSARAWLNVSRSFLVNRLAFALPGDRVALELLEDQVVDDRLLSVLRELRAAGFSIVLDDFVFTPERAPLVELADVVKIDVLALGTIGAAQQLDALRHHDVTLVAEKVETQEDFALCRRLGFDLFQGYFFCRPEVMSAQGVGANRLTLLQLVAAVQDPRIELGQLKGLIARDVALSYRLLRYINSAFFSLRREVDSISRALVLLGLENVRRWATMTILAAVEEKPRELIVTALVRARLCELLGPLFDEPNADQLFTLGLFSVIDALMDTSMEDVLARLPFPEDMVEALVSQRGPKGELLTAALLCERGVLPPPRAGVPVGAIAELHLQALVWAEQAARELLQPADAGESARAAA